MKMAIGHLTFVDWICQNLIKGANIGYDPALLSAEVALARTAFFRERGIDFKPINKNLINEIWADRPKMPNEKLFIHDIKYAGIPVEQKVFMILNQLYTFGVNYLFTSILDEVAWLLNLRGKDIQYNPLFFSFLLVHASYPGYQIILFVDPEKTDEIQSYLDINHIEVRPYESVAQYLGAIDDKIMIDKNEINFSLFQQIKQPIHCPNLISKIKEIKNPREMQGFRDSHVRDGIAMAKYFS